MLIPVLPTAYEADASNGEPTVGSRTSQVKASKMIVDKMEPGSTEVLHSITLSITQEIRNFNLTQ